jgi:hypothetical protein
MFGDFIINIVNNPWFFVGIAGLFGAYVLLLSTVLAVWTSRDIKQRTNSRLAHIGTPVFIFLFGFAAFLPYLVLRPRKTFDDLADERREQLLLTLPAQTTLCPSCKKTVGETFAFCPHCQAVFRAVCTCGATLEADWKRCAYCGTDVPASAKNAHFAQPVFATQVQRGNVSEQIPANVNEPRRAKAVTVQKKLAAPKLNVQTLADKIAASLRQQDTKEVKKAPVITIAEKKAPVATVLPAKKSEKVEVADTNVKKEAVGASKSSLPKEKLPMFGQFSLAMRKLLAIKK